VTASRSPRRISESTFTVVCNGFADGPAQALRDHLVAEGARRVVMVSHPLTPEGGGGHVVAVHEAGAVTTRTVRAPHRPPLTYPLDLVVPLRLPRSDLWVGFNPLAALRGLAERRLGRTGAVVTWNVDFVPERFGPGLATRVYDAVDRRVATRADARVELSDAAREGRDQRLGLGHGRAAAVAVVPMGAWCTTVAAAPDDAWAPELRLAYLGHLVPRQGVDRLLGAVAELRARGIAATADIVGGGPEREPLEALARRLDISGAVTFHGFVAASDEVERILAGCHVGVAPYVDDGTSFTQFADPGKLKAYAAAGLPVVVTPVPPNAQDLADAGVAVVVADDPTAIADGVLEVAGTAEAWRGRHQAALAYAGGFDWAVLLSRWLEGVGFVPDRGAAP
jgi:glycosyltransferase involved in cell wall biosynthesis